MSDDGGEAFMLTHAEAIANYAFGDDLIYVQRDEGLATCVVYVGLLSKPGEQIEFDWGEYWKSLDSDNKNRLIFTLVEFHDRDGQIPE